MKKILSAFFLLFTVCSALFLVSCTTECEHEHLTCTVVPPTCETEGYTVNTCVECKAEFKTKYVLPTGHELKETAFAPTCDKEGYAYYSCDCGYSYKSNIIPPLGHNYTHISVDPLCETAGYTEHTCSVCEYSYRSDFIAALGHNIKKVISYPTESSVGYTEYSCTVCQHNYKDDFVFYSDIYGGGTIPSTTVVAKGIDVSKWQNPTAPDGSYEGLDWQKIKASGIEFAILRAGNTRSESGNINKDPVFEMNYSDAKAAGVMVGAYYYSVATTEEKLDEEIDALIGWLDGKEFEYPIYIDIEDSKLQSLSKDALTKLCMRFVRRMRENGYYGAVYSNKTWLERHLDREALTAFCDIWFAYHTIGASTPSDEIYAWNEAEYGLPFSMWQYTFEGVIEGSNMPTGVTVDMNYCYKDYATIMNTYGLNGFSLNTE